MGKLTSYLICIIDDQPANLEILKIILCDEGYEVISACDAIEGIEIIEATLPNLILLDIMMPDIDGFETCRCLKASEKTKDIPVIFMSALRNTKDKVKGLKLGAVDYIEKPFEPQEVLARINNQIQVQQLNQKLNQQNELLRIEIKKRKQTEFALIESEKRLQKILNTNVNGLLLINEEGEILYSNPSADKLFNHENQSLVGKILGIPLTLLENQSNEIEIPQKTGKLITVEMRKVDIIWEEKKAYLISLIDITERKKIEEQLQIFFQATEQSPALIVITNIDGNIEYVNPKFEEISGYKKEEVLGKNPRILKSGNKSQDEYKGLWDTIKSGKQWYGEFQNKKKTGEIYWESASISPILDVEKNITHFVAVKEDITLKKHQEILLKYQANYDSLTKIPNREFALQQLEKLIENDTINEQKIGLMYIDLDKFKDVNDSFGHDYGNELLKHTASRIKNVLRKTDIVARLGGDEFLVITPFINNSYHLKTIVKKIIISLQQSFNLSGTEVFISASIGIAIYPDDGLNVKDLIRHADTAMFQAKRNGKNNFQFFNEKMNQVILHRIKLEKNLLLGLKKQEFKLVYQPVIDLKTRKIVSAEALMRWENDELGVVSPQEFIPIAEDTGFIVELGKWLLLSVCQEALKWQNIFPLSVAINLSPRQFKRTNLLQSIHDALEKTNFNPSLLQLEITENLFLEDLQDIKETLSSINNMKIGLSLDDFGTGYSALSYLSKYPFNTLKIDQSFIKEMIENPRVFVLVETIIVMAKSLNLKVIAEGIENEKQLDLLLKLNCSHGQGYLFSKPLNKDEFMNFLEVQSL